MQPNGYFGAPQAPQLRKRPTFLLVLCILTFVGSGWGVLGGLISFMNDPQEDIRSAQADMSLEFDEISDQPMGTFLIDTFDYAVAYADNFYMVNGVNILLAVLSLLGAFMMFNMRKPGYYLYVLANIAMAFAPYLIIINSISTAQVVGYTLLSVLFIVLYGLNLKHMR